MPVLAVSSLGVRRRVGIGAGGSDGVCVASDIFLARQRNPLDPRPGLYFAKQMAHNNLGIALADHGQVDSAIAHYQKALEIKPDYAEAHYNLGIRSGRPRTGSTRPSPITRRPWKSSPTTPRPTTTSASPWPAADRSTQAIAHYQKALEIKPDYAEAHNNLGIALAGRAGSTRRSRIIRRPWKSSPTTPRPTTTSALPWRPGRIDEAIAQYQQALEIKPDYAEAHYNLGIVLARPRTVRRGDGPVSEGAGNQARLRRGPQQPGHVLAACGRLDEAMAHFRKALEIKPDYAEAHKTWAPPWPRGPVRRGHWPSSRGVGNPAGLRRSPQQPGLAAGDLPAGVAAKRRRGDRACPACEPALWRQAAGGAQHTGRRLRRSGAIPRSPGHRRKALDLATQQTDRALAAVLRSRVRLYEAGKPYRQPPSASAPPPPKP